MSRSERKADVQVSHPGHIFPFSSAALPPHTHINQWCRFSIPERLPLKPFRQDRLTRLPLPPSIMTTSKVTYTTGAVPQLLTLNEKRGGIDPFIKIQQLEKSLVFVQENHTKMLESLHEEIEDLKLKNRELLFELVTGVPPLPKELPEKDKEISDEHIKTIEKLEKEVNKLQNALKDAAKTNASLSNQMQELKREQQYSKHSSRNRIYNKTPPDSAIEDGHKTHSPSGPSPQMEDYSDTLRQIQRAANHRNGKREGRNLRKNDGNIDWSDGYLRNGNGYRHHHYHQSHRSPRQQHQPRLPRLPLRNQQNYSHPQYEIQYHQRSSNTLPALKQPLVPVVDHRLDKPRKSRGPRPPPPKIDQVTN